MPSSELLKLTISEVAPMIQAREVSPVDLTEAALAEAERQQPTLNFIHHHHARAGPGPG